MAPGSVLVDLAAERGGNCELTRAGEIIVDHDVTIDGQINLASSVPYHASQMYARNLSAFLIHLVKDRQLQLDSSDEIIRETLLTHRGEIVNARVRKFFSLPDLVAPDAFEAILNIHFRVAADPGPAGFLGVVGGTAEWIFVKDGVVSITVSAANRLVDLPAEALAERVWEDVKTALGLPDPMPPVRVVKEKRATFAATAAQETRRPAARTSLGNLVLAGDWTATGLPATIEGAIRSGRTAANLIGPV
jgi:hypothetical protein